MHLFVFDDQTRHLLDSRRQEWWQEDGWNVLAFERDTTLMAIATRTGTDALTNLTQQLGASRGQT